MGKKMLTPQPSSNTLAAETGKRIGLESAGENANKGNSTRKPPVDKTKTLLYMALAVAVVILFLPLMVVIHELGHAVAITLLGGEVTGYKFSLSGASVYYRGISNERDLFIVHLSGVLANILIGGYSLFHVWRFKGHPFQEAFTLIWGIILILADIISYTISDIFYDHGGDFDKIYDSYPWSVPIFLLIDLVLVLLIFYVLSLDAFWKGIQLPRKKI